MCGKQDLIRACGLGRGAALRIGLAQPGVASPHGARFTTAPFKSCSIPYNKKQSPDGLCFLLVRETGLEPA